MSYVGKIIIKALDEKDLEVISALMQDAIIRVEDLEFEKNTHQFACLTNRFRWETIKTHKGERVRSLLRFEHVLNASYKHIPFKSPGHVLNFLSLDCQDIEEGLKILTLNFSGFAAIRLKVELIEAYLDDFLDHWETRHIPIHDILEDSIEK